MQQVVTWNLMSVKDDISIKIIVWLFSMPDDLRRRNWRSAQQRCYLIQQATCHARHASYANDVNWAWRNLFKISEWANWLQKDKSHVLLPVARRTLASACPRSCGSLDQDRQSTSVLPPGLSTLPGLLAKSYPPCVVCFHRVTDLSLQTQADTRRQVCPSRPKQT